MRIFYLLIIICVSTKVYSQSDSNKAFARLENNKFVINADTIKFKSTVSHLFKDSKTPPNFTLHINTAKTLGEAVEDYYYILLRDNSQNISIARWLEKIGDDFYVVEDSDSTSSWQLFTTICIGADKCMPNVFIIEGKKHWICGQELVCKDENSCAKTTAILNE